MAQTDDALWDALAGSRLLTTDQLSAAKRFFQASAASSGETALRQLVERKWLTSFQAERLFKGQARGFFYDEYKITDLLGLGGMGWIYQAVHTETGQVVALKAMRQGFQHDQGLLARFQQEAKVGLLLHHPHIVETYRLGSAGGLPYLAMELIAGPNLQELLYQQRRLPWDQACELGRQLAVALSYVHHRGIIHRDIKPQNVLIDPNGRVRILDFGLSMIQEGETGDEFSFAMIFGHESVGTWEYSAPEQIEDSLSADARSDIYSIGGTLFAALTGTNPSAGQDRTSARNKSVRNVRELQPAIPVEIADIVAKMLAPDPHARFATADEVEAALARWANPEPVVFDYPAILKERKRAVALRLAKTPSGRTVASSLGRSTARPGDGSSVAQASPQESPNFLVEYPADAVPDPNRLSPLTTLIKGPALRWANEAPRVGPAGMVLKLHNAAGRIPMQEDLVLVGRAERSHLQIVSSLISSRHCEIHFDGRQWWITDLESLNGTRVNGKAVKRQALRSGDEIDFGNAIKFHFQSAQTDKTVSASPRRSDQRWAGMIIAMVLIAIAAVVLGITLLR